MLKSTPLKNDLFRKMSAANILTLSKIPIYNINKIEGRTIVLDIKVNEKKNFHKGLAWK